MVGPDYHKPDTVTPAGWKTAPDAGQVAIGQRWWEVYNDLTLNSLQDQADAASPQLSAAIARVMQARAIAQITDADFYPQVTLDPTASRARVSGNRPIQPGSPATSFCCKRFQSAPGCGLRGRLVGQDPACFRIGDGPGRRRLPMPMEPCVSRCTRT